MAYLPLDQLDKGWRSLADRFYALVIPGVGSKSGPSNADAKSFLFAYDAFDTRHLAQNDPNTGRLVRPFTVRELEIWTQGLNEQLPTIQRLEATFPKQGQQSGSGKVRSGEDIESGAPKDWWYWISRIAAASVAGYVAYQVYKQPTYREGEFAGVRRYRRR
jgi:hypothetical protein